MNGYEHIFPTLIAFSERNCRSLFANGKSGPVRFWFAVNDSFAYMRKALAGSGYSEYPEKEFMNCIYPSDTAAAVRLAEDFRLLYGEACPDETKKWSALRLGFHPEYETQDYRASMDPYIGRKSHLCIRTVSSVLS